MTSAGHTQSLTDFREKAAETLERLRQTGAAEIITVNGEARAVLLSPAAYDELVRDALLARDVAVIRQAVKESEAGRGRPAEDVFDELRAELLAVKSANVGGRQ